MLHAENRKDPSQKRRIPGQPDVGCGNFLRAAQPIDSMLQPVLGDIAVHERVGGDGGKSKNEQKPQRDGGQRDKQKKAQVLAHKLAHAKEYTA